MEEPETAVTDGYNSSDVSEMPPKFAVAVRAETSPLLSPTTCTNQQQPPNYNSIPEPTKLEQGTCARDSRPFDSFHTLWASSHQRAGLKRSIEPPPTRSFSRLFGFGPSQQKLSNSYRQSWLHSWKKRSRILSIDPSSQLGNVPREPLVIFKDLLDLLLSYDVPGPLLFRMNSEFTALLGHGRTFEVFGASEFWFTEAGSSDVLLNLPKSQDKNIPGMIDRTWKALPKIAIKRAYISRQRANGSSASLSSEMATRAFGQQLNAVEREILNLCHPQLRYHKNIVSILGWGLCLDNLENLASDGPRIPLLVVERAHSSMSAFIRDEMQGSLSPDNACNICLDIGRGLQAIHNSGMVHGDIKLDNVLIFLEDGRWTAKLSDFGLTASAQSLSAGQGTREYRGTPRWCPPPGSSRYALKELYAFDYFAYGLVVWCAFTGRDRSPLPPDGTIAANSNGPYASKHLYDTAVEGLDLGSWRVRVQAVLLSCLHDDARFWKAHPWKFFDMSLYPTVERVTNELTPFIRLSGVLKGVQSAYYSNRKTLIDAADRLVTTLADSGKQFTPG